MRDPIIIGGTRIAPGTQRMVELRMPRLNSHTQMTLPVHVFHGRREGPALFVSAALHGDELNGIEVVRRLLEVKGLKRLAGTLLLVPVVNVYGLIHHSRYLPDRRDLNRSFPGSETGSLAGRLAHLFLTEVVAHCGYGIDLHTGAVHRANLAQVRANLEDAETLRLSRAFGVPVLLNSAERDGSLRQAAVDMGARVMIYEVGEALRYDDLGIRAGVRGVLNVMRALGMLPARARGPKPREAGVVRASRWVRAPESGMFRALVALGAQVERGQLLGYVGDPYSGVSIPVTADANGLVIGRSQIPVVHEGEAIYHIARFKGDIDGVVEQVEAFHEDFAAIAR